jgi:hypothetical protein
MKAFFRLPHWLKNGLAGQAPPLPYQITCTCGQAAEGLRQATHQVIRCGNCQRELFVLPASRLPAVIPPDTVNSSQKSAVIQSPSSPWLWPLVAGALTLLAAVLAYAFLFDRLAGRRQDASEPTIADLHQHLAVGRKALVAGDFQQAQQELDSAQAILTAHPRNFSAAQGQDTRQLQRQAALLKDWVSREPLELTLAPAMALKTDDWQAVTARYRGKAFVFDVELRREGRQLLAKASRKFAGPTLHFELQNLKLLGYLPLDVPQRILFAARLAEVRRQGTDSCIVRLEPDSGILLTDTSSIALGGMIAEQPLQAILKQQRQWVADVP